LKQRHLRSCTQPPGIRIGSLQVVGSSSHLKRRVKLSSQHAELPFAGKRE
jgi:hypothetical protein